MEEKTESYTLNDKLFRHMITNNWVAVVFANMENKVEYANPAACELYGYSEEELIGQTTDIFNSGLSHNTDDIVQSITSKGYWTGELIQRKKDNSTFEALLSVQLITDDNGVPVGFASNSKDITKDKENSIQLKKSIEEKDILLKELHHRVKNNLSIIRGILSLQSVQYSDDNSSRLISDFKNRIDAVATMHKKLYHPGNLYDLNLYEFVQDLSASLTKSYNQHNQKVTIQINAFNYFANIEQAAPLCLVINEVLTNSFKHAFEEQNDAKISIDGSTENNCFILSIKDNGKGFDYNASAVESLGLQLISDLTAQIDATFKYESQIECGTSFQIKLNKSLEHGD